MTDGETNTLALRGLEEPFSSCAVCCVSFWFWREKGFGSILVQIRIHYLEYNTVVVVRKCFACSGIFFFGRHRQNRAPNRQTTVSFFFRS